MDEFQKELECTLTDEEINKYAKDLAKGQQDKNEAELKKKSVVSDYNDKIARFDADIQSVARKISNGFEHRFVKCRYHYDWPRGKKYVVRLDTGEQVSAEDITERDRQMKLEMDNRK